MESLLVLQWYIHTLQNILLPDDEMYTQPPFPVVLQLEKDMDSKSNFWVEEEESKQKTPPLTPVEIISLKIELWT